MFEDRRGCIALAASDFGMAALALMAIHGVDGASCEMSRKITKNLNN